MSGELEFSGPNLVFDFNYHFKPALNTLATEVRSCFMSKNAHKGKFIDSQKYKVEFYLFYGHSFYNFLERVNANSSSKVTVHFV